MPERTKGYSVNEQTLVRCHCSTGCTAHIWVDTIIAIETLAIGRK